MRIIVVSPDEELCENIAQSVGATGAILDTFRSPGALGPQDFDAQLYVIHFTELLASSGGITYLERIAPTSRVVILLARGSLASLVDIMRASSRVVGMFVADAVDYTALFALAQRVLGIERLGVAQLLPGAEVHTWECSYAERKACASVVSRLLVKHGVSRTHQIQIEQCLDEMLMNALYDAPVDSAGNPVFGNVPARTRVTLKLATSIRVQLAIDGKRIAIAVRDNFGSLTRQTVLRVLHKCLHQQDKLDRKAGGAGVGLYLMVNASTAVYFTVTPGVKTEAICCFDLAPMHQLERFAYTEAVGDQDGAPLSAADLRPAPMRSRFSWRLGLPLAVVLVAVAATFVATRNRTSAPVRPAVIVLDSVPNNATVELDGKLIGHTPLELTTLAPSSNVVAVLRLLGHHDAKVQLQVPPRGERFVHIEKLVASDEFVTVRVESEPPGARVIQPGAPTGAARTYTPAELVLKTSTPHTLVLVMPGHAPLALEPFTLERGAKNVEKRGRLQPGVLVKFTSKATGAIVVDGDPVCRELLVPAECTLAAGPHKVSFTAQGGAAITKPFEAKAEHTVDLDVP